MKKGISVLLILACAASLLAQSEIAMVYNPGDHPVEESPRPVTTESFVSFRSVEMFKPVMKPVEVDSTFFRMEHPASKLIQDLPSFGYGITYAQDTVAGCTLINLDKVYQELMIFVKDQEGKMLLAQLVQLADKARLDLNGEGPFRIEILTNKGDKATLDVPAF